MTSRFSGLRWKQILVLAGVAVLAVPVDAFGCWNLCVQTYGYYREMYGTWWELDHCTQSWPDDVEDGPLTTCYYRRYFNLE